MIKTFSINFLLPSIRIESSDGSSISITVILLFMISRLKFSTAAFFTNVSDELFWENNEVIIIAKRINRKIFFFIVDKVYSSAHIADRLVNWFWKNL